MAEPVAYIKYNATGITAIIGASCITPQELDTIGAQPEGLEPYMEPEVLRCDRCGEVCE